MSKHASIVLLSATALMAGINAADTGDNPDPWPCETWRYSPGADTEALFTDAPMKTAIRTPGRDAKMLAFEPLGKTDARMVWGASQVLWRYRIWKAAPLKRLISAMS